MLAIPASALASSSTGIENLHFAAGPYKVIPGANLILTQFNKVPKPKVNGFMIQMKPNLVYAKKDGKCCGTIPSTSIVHLHHGVWLSNGTAGEGEGNSSYGGFYPFMAAGEEKTTIEFPAGYGYPIGAKDLWILNYMIHNLTDKPYEVYITYDMEFVPETSPLAAHITAVHPIWMDVQDNHIYPVFNVYKGSGVNGKFTYPDMAADPYGSGRPLNEFTVDHAGTLIGTAGHVHPGGLYDELDLIRNGRQAGRRGHPGPRPQLGSAVPLPRPVLRQAWSGFVGRLDGGHECGLASGGTAGGRHADQHDLQQQHRVVVRGHGHYGRVGGVERPDRRRSVQPCD